MAQYTAVFTTYGTQQLAKAIANNNPLTVTHFAVGDGNGNAVTVSASQERLVNEKYRATISAVSLDPRNNKQVVFELTIPENVGGFYLREMGVFDAQNKLIAYANCPESFKPTLASGSGKVQVMRMILLVASSNAVTLTVDDSVIFVTRGQLTPKTITANSANGFDNTGHSHAIDKASTTTAGIVQLTSDTGLESENLGLTAKAGKILAQGIAALRLALNNYIPNSKKSNAINSNNNDTVATSAAVKSANDNANARVAKSGDTMTGDLSIKQGDYSGISFYNNNGYYLRLEGNPEAGSNMLAFVYRKPNGENVAVASLPKKNGTIAYVDDVVLKNGGSMRGTISFTGSTEGYKIGGYSWGMPIKLIGDTFIGNEVTGIGFNNNGSLHLGGRPNSNEFLVSIDSAGIYTSGNVRSLDVMLKSGKKLSLSHQTTDQYVETTSKIWGGLKINRNGDHMLIESNDRGGFSFVRRNSSDGSNFYVLSAPAKNGTLALTSEVVSDIRFGSQIYRTETDNIPTGGYILEGTRVQGGTRTLVYKTIQKLVNGNWYTVSG